MNDIGSTSDNTGKAPLMLTRSELAGTAALAIDSILTEDPALAEAVARTLDATVPVQFRDQFEAAAQHGRDAISTATAKIGWRGSALHPTEYPAWIRLGALSTITRWIAGVGSTCMHSPVQSRPQPLFAAAWLPGLVACGQCSHLFKVSVGSRIGRTCDCCGLLTAGTADDGISASILQIGVVFYTFGYCDECDPW